MMFNIKLTVTEPPGNRVNEFTVGLLALPATPKMAVGVLPEELVMVGLGPDVPAPAKVVVAVAVMAGKPNGIGRTSWRLTP